MTAFQVYLLMQADSICLLFGFLAIISGIAFVITTTGRCMSAAYVSDSERAEKRGDWLTWNAFVRLHHWAMAFFFPALLISTFMPGTKTIATMIVLPKITSPAAMQKLGEKGEELYNITREALQGLADRAKPTKTTTPVKKP